MIDKKIPTREKMLEAMAALCARAEQCEADLRRKMKLKGMLPADIDSIIDYLYEHRFLDIDRYAGAYARDKMRYSHWGRLKIRMILAGKRIPAYAVKEALDSLDEGEYRLVLASLVKTAARSLDLSDRNDRAKLTRRLYTRGFEPTLIADTIREQIKSEK